MAFDEHSITLESLFELLKPYIGTKDERETCDSSILFEGLRLWVSVLYPQCRFLIDTVLSFDTKLLVRSRASEDEEDEETSIVPATLTSYAVVGSIVAEDGTILAKGISSPMRLHDPEDEAGCPDWTVKKLEEAWRQALSTLGVSEKHFWNRVTNDANFLDKIGANAPYATSSETRGREMHYAEHDKNDRNDEQANNWQGSDTTTVSSVDSSKSILFKTAMELWLKLREIKPAMAKESVDAYCAFSNLAQRASFLDDEGLFSLINQLTRQIKTIS